LIGARSSAAIVAMGVAAFAVAPVASDAAKAKKPKPRTVKVEDNPTYALAPGTLTVKKGTTIVWKWQSSNFDSHDVELKKRPKGAKKFHSDIASTDFTFKRKLTVKGKYTVICSLHPFDMRQTITVK
jgi:plastocyanin